jgi:hypothetical protein
MRHFPESGDICSLSRLKEFTLRDSGFLTIVIKTSLQIPSMERVETIEV